MNDGHISDITMSLYLRGGTKLRKQLVEWIQTHLGECDLCAEKLEEALNEMADQLRPTEPEKLDLEVNVLDKIIRLLSLPLRNPSCWDKLKGLCSQLVEILSESEGLTLEGVNTQRLSLLTQGDMYTPPSDKEKNAKNTENESQEKQEIGEKVLSLLEILGDDEIPIAKRAELAEELLLLAQQKSISRIEKDKKVRED